MRQAKKRKERTLGGARGGGDSIRPIAKIEDRHKRPSPSETKHTPTRARGGSPPGGMERVIGKHDLSHKDVIIIVISFFVFEIQPQVESKARVYPWGLLWDP